VRRQQQRFPNWSKTTKVIPNFEVLNARFRPALDCTAARGSCPMLPSDRASTLTKPGTNQGGGSGSFFDMLPTAAVLAFGATLPAALGASLGYESVGFTAAFGAYLVTITHADLPTKGRAQRLVATILMLSVGAIAGASAGQRVWIFLPLAAVGASWQAWTEIADTGLRFPAALAVLALLVSTGNVSPDLPVATYGAAFAGGAVWQGLVQYVAARPSDMPPVTLASDFKALISSVTAARRFIVTMATLGVAGGAIAASLPLPHAAWLLTAALRVMKPSQAVTRLRLKHRFIGTAAGAIVSAGLLGWQLPPLLYAGLLGVMLTVMQLVGTRRYAIWTFCLTVIALDLGQRSHEIGWHAAEDRILLTIGGVALAWLFSFRLP
jgi:Fusaric acid resistance protein-like